MTKEFLFWIIMILAALGAGGPFFISGEKKWFAVGGGLFLLWVAVALLGWAEFGAAIK